MMESLKNNNTHANVTIIQYPNKIKRIFNPQSCQQPMQSKEITLNIQVPKSQNNPIDAYFENNNNSEKTNEIVRQLIKS